MDKMIAEAERRIERSLTDKDANYWRGQRNALIALKPAIEAAKVSHKECTTHEYKLETAKLCPFCIAFENL